MPLRDTAVIHSVPPTYSNPILNADWPDPDVVAVDGMYYLVASSFNRVPGLPILRSENLVDWQHAGHALDRLPPEAHFSRVRPGGGVWAPSMRFHDGRFWIFYPDPDHGIFVLTAKQAEGPWSAPHLLYPGRGLIDPCPLWDDDGRAYLVHGWAHSRAGIRNRLTVHEMSPDGSRLLGSGRTVIDGDALPGYTTLEGPKFYKRDGWYWIFAPAGGVSTGWQSVFRSASVFGPYEDRVVLEQGDTAVNGPHQGAWVHTPAGEDWFLHFQDRGPYGRVVHLQPMRWVDGWPVLGAAAPGNPAGIPVLTHPYPAGTARQDVEPPRSDDFRSPVLGRQWHWAANPQPGWLDLPGDGTLRLRPVPADGGDLRTVPNLLAQVLPGSPSDFTTSLRLEGVPEGTRAGVAVVGLSYAWLSLERTADGYVVNAGVGGEQAGTEDSCSPEPVHDASIEVRVRTDESHLAHFSWRPVEFRLPEGRDADEPPARAPWRSPAWSFPLSKGRWIGAELGLFALAPSEPRAGAADLPGSVIVGPVKIEPAPANSSPATVPAGT